MAKGYWVAHMDIEDVDKYKNYQQANMDFLQMTSFLLCIYFLKSPFVLNCYLFTVHEQGALMSLLYFISIIVFT